MVSPYSPASCRLVTERDRLYTVVLIREWEISMKFRLNRVEKPMAKTINEARIDRVNYRWSSAGNGCNKKYSSRRLLQGVSRGGAKKGVRSIT